MVYSGQRSAACAAKCAEMSKSATQKYNCRKSEGWRKYVKQESTECRSCECTRHSVQMHYTHTLSLDVGTFSSSAGMMIAINRASACKQHPLSHTVSAAQYAAGPFICVAAYRHSTSQAASKEVHKHIVSNGSRGRQYVVMTIWCRRQSREHT